MLIFYFSALTAKPITDDVDNDDDEDDDYILIHWAKNKLQLKSPELYPITTYSLKLGYCLYGVLHSLPMPKNMHVWIGNLLQWLCVFPMFSGQPQEPPHP